MARRNREFEFNNLYHIVNKFNPELWIDDGYIAGIEAIIAKASIKYGVNVTEFCILNNHFHLAVYFPKESETTISKYMQSIGTSIAKYVNKILKRKGRVFIDRFYSELLNSLKSFAVKLKYIRDNIKKHRPFYDFNNWLYSSNKYYKDFENKIEKLSLNFITHYNIIANKLFNAPVPEN